MIGCLKGRMTETADLNHAQLRLIGSKTTSKKMIGLTALSMTVWESRSNVKNGLAAKQAGKQEDK